jgi:hypothetical protein
MKESKVLFDAKKLAAEMMKNLSAEQTNRLIEYAKTEIKRLGEMMEKGDKDRTGHLLNSLCWGVTYNGELKDSGFYRQATLHTYVNRYGQERGRGVHGGTNSYLHEYFINDREIVLGRELAEEYIGSVKGKSGKWTVFFAVLAPYWGYWESGFTHIKTGRRMQFQVMTHIFDDVRIDLKPAKTHITVYVPKYSYKNPKYKKKKGIKKIGIIR